MNDKSITPDSVTHTEPVELNYVNSTVSWQARLLNAALRKLVKSRMGRFTDIATLRNFIRKIDRILATTTQGVTGTDMLANGVPSRWLKHEEQCERVILYLHGGGFCLHMPHTYEGFVSRLCREIGASALLPDYRLAPEHPFPAAVDDVFNAYKYLLERGFKAENIGIIGDSGGGCLNLNCLMKIRDHQLPMPGCAVLLSPGTMLLERDQQTLQKESADPLFNLDVLHFFMAAYLADNQQQTAMQAMPLYSSFDGLPPLQFHVGSTELLLDHSLQAAKKAEDAGSEVSLKVWDQMPHVHPLFRFLPESDQAIGIMADFVKRHIDSPR